MHTVAVCETEPVAVEGLRKLFETADEFDLVATENSLADGLEAVQQCRPTVLVLDKALGGLAVTECLRFLPRFPQGPAVMVWGTSLSEAEALRFLQAGALGVVRKTAPLETILTCLRTVAAGTTWMEEEMLYQAETYRGAQYSPLTPREVQVMEYVEQGLKNREIALALGIRVGTVKIHLKHIFEKTGIRGRYGLALSGLKQKGLLVSAT